MTPKIFNWTLVLDDESKSNWLKATPEERVLLHSCISESIEQYGDFEGMVEL